MKKKKKKEIIKYVLLFIIIIASIFYSDIEDFITRNEITSSVSDVVNYDADNLQIYYVDVGQADCILIRYKDKNLLIDAGNNEDGAKIVTYFKSLGITKFNYVIGTHAHEDHIGGMNTVIDNFDIDKFYMPDVITTTKTFEDVLDSLEKKNIKFSTPKIDSKFNVDDLEFNVLYVGEDSQDLNNTSIVLKMVYNKTSYLFTGDATSTVEKKILDKDIKSDVLKVGHHGSQYSTSSHFLKKVDPKYAIIQVGKDNKYDHPKDVTIKKLNTIDAQIYRTDLDGTIILTSDGENISIRTEKTDTNG